MVRKRNLYKKVIQLRKQGKSYNLIARELMMAKSTISDWLTGQRWSQIIKKELTQKQMGNQRHKLILMSRANSALKMKRDEKYRGDAIKEFEYLKKIPLFILGLGIYWGEGDKTNNGRVAVANTDARMLKIVAAFYRNCLKIENAKLRAGLFVYEDMDPNKFVNFWSKILSLPKSQFIKVQILKSRSRLTKRRSKYGICSLYFSSTEISIKIQQWIKLIADVA